MRHIEISFPYPIFYYFKKYLPNIFILLLEDRELKKENFWKEKHVKLNCFYESKADGEKYEPNLFDVIRMAEKGDKVKLCFLKQIDNVSKKLFEGIGFII